jgi:hypothetical protein
MHAKTILSLGYVDYVVDIQDAVTIAQLLANAEIYKEEYKDGTTTKSITANPERRSEMRMRILGHVEYNMYKLAGE